MCVKSVKILILNANEPLVFQSFISLTKSGVTDLLSFLIYIQSCVLILSA